MEAYAKAAPEQFSYLVLGLHPETPDVLHFRTHVLPSEGVVLVGNEDANLITCYAP